ncbi:DUF488 domain-containing protein [Rothia amarae]|uniref:DUF488 domain-containing protein n=1 Tax=Rothia amarae TaxID=169480 RepID=A0A7H2BLI0_9MICC|nr:DUF488 domain-containing protein [Rothia amarae]QNV40526.1 DUF488 domain-containing protein [Rothia amarae]
MKIHIKRIFEDKAQGDGTRILVDRIWPRGIKKEDAEIDDWAKVLAPSTEARKDFNHDPDKFEEFSERYEQELEQSDEVQDYIDKLKADKPQNLTLLFAAKDTEHNHALVLQKYLQKHIAGASLGNRPKG